MKWWMTIPKFEEKEEVIPSPRQGCIDGVYQPRPGERSPVISRPGVHIKVVKLT